MKPALPAVLLAVSLFLAPVAHLRAQAGETTATPPEMVAAYESLATVLISAKATEWHLVDSIISATHAHAHATWAGIRARLQAGQDARADIEKLATLVGQLGNEGDARVSEVRNRLLKGGYNHHASDANQGVYDDGFVIVTRVARKAFLDAAGRIGRLAATPDAAAIGAQMQAVDKQFQDLHATAK